jgi:hypothetical protein
VNETSHTVRDGDVCLAAVVSSDNFSSTAEASTFNVASCLPHSSPAMPLISVHKAIAIHRTRQNPAGTKYGVLKFF